MADAEQLRQFLSDLSDPPGDNDRHDIRSLPAMTQALSEWQRISNRYAAFAVDEARGASEIYERLALEISASPELLRFVASLPADRRQPNLFFAAVRHLCGVADHLVAVVRQEHGRTGGGAHRHPADPRRPTVCHRTDAADFRLLYRHHP